MSFDIVQVEVNNTRSDLKAVEYGFLIRYSGPYNLGLSKLAELSDQGFELKTTHLSANNVVYTFQRSRSYSLTTNTAPAIEI